MVSENHSFIAYRILFFYIKEGFIFTLSFAFVSASKFLKSVNYKIFFIILFLITFILLILHNFSNKYIFLTLNLIRNLLDNYILQNDLSSIWKIKQPYWKHFQFLKNLLRFLIKIKLHFTRQIYFTRGQTSNIRFPLYFPFSPINFLFDSPKNINAYNLLAFNV